jgi:hypothetical protein
MRFRRKRVHSLSLRIYGIALAPCAEQDEEFTKNLPVQLLGAIYTLFPLLVISDGSAGNKRERNYIIRK